MFFDSRAHNHYNDHRNVKKRLAILAFCAILILAAGLRIGADIRSPANAEFRVRIIGIEGTEFEGFCTHEVRYLIGSRTEATDLQGEMTAGEDTFDFVVPGVEISCVIKNRMADNPITVILLKGDTEVNRVEGTGDHFYLDWYPHAELTLLQKPLKASVHTSP